MEKRRVAVRAIILKGNELLCVRLKQYPGRINDGGRDFWCLPGGGVDVGEPLLAALEREIIEELGVRPTIGSLLFVQQFQHENYEQLEFFFKVTNVDEFVSLNIEKTTHGKIEIAEAAFIDPACKNLLPVF